MYVLVNEDNSKHVQSVLSGKFRQPKHQRYNTPMSPYLDRSDPLTPQTCMISYLFCHALSREENEQKVGVERC